jgi:transglutaminase-like putative cysteine protease
MCLLLFAVLSVAPATAADEPQANGQQTHSPVLEAGPYRVTSTLGRKLSITITHDLPPMQGVVYFPLPSDTSSQKVTACKLTVVSDKRKFQQIKAFETGPLKKPVLEVVLKQRSGGKAIVELDIDMFAARLEPGEPEQPPRKLKGTERTALTAADWHYEYETGPFRRWMADNALSLAKSERDADFALRVLEFIRRNFDYKIPDPQEMQDKITRLKIDELAYYISEKAAECWGLSSIYTSVLRASGIPCRQMSGFVLDPRPLRRGGHHVRAEVYLEGTGWILVEVAGAVTAKDWPLLSFFGHRGDDMILIDQGINYRLAGPREPGNIGTLSGFAIGTASGEWSFPYANWEINVRE